MTAEWQLTAGEAIIHKSHVTAAGAISHEEDKSTMLPQYVSA